MSEVLLLPRRRCRCMWVRTGCGQGAVVVVTSLLSHVREGGRVQVGEDEMGEALSSCRRCRVWREGGRDRGMQTRVAGMGMSVGQQGRTCTRVSRSHPAPIPATCAGYPNPCHSLNQLV